MRAAALGTTRPAFVAAALALALSACGYRPIRNGLAGAPHVRVEGAHASLPGGAAALVAEEAATGARAELARWGALEDGDAAGVDRLRIDVVRLDEHSEGAEVVEGRPHARGVRLRLLARGTISGARGSFETPDVEATELVAAPDDALSWEAARAAAVRRIARVAGAGVAREVLGVP